MARLIGVFALLSGVLLVVAGVVFVVIYFKDAIFLRLGEPDQSLIFWYLPFLFVGFGGVISGLVIGNAGLNKLRARPCEKKEGE